MACAAVRHARPIPAGAISAALSRSRASWWWRHRRHDPLRRGCCCSPSGFAAGNGSLSGGGKEEEEEKEFEIDALVRPHLKTLAAYKPIEPFEVLSAKLGRDPGDIVKLDANENLYGPPDKVRRVLAEMAFPHIYPDPECRKLRTLLAEETGCDMANIVIGCGADELIDLIMRIMLEPGDAIVDCPPTFTMYAFDAAINDARVVRVMRKDGFALDLQGIQQAVQAHQPKILFLTSPNNPDGSEITEDELEFCLQLPLLVVLDQAYAEFSDKPPITKLVETNARQNLVVLRTFSKRAALAGLRVGYGIFPPQLAQYMWRARQPYSVSAPAEAAAVAALESPEYLSQVRGAILSERARLYEALQSMPMLHPYPSSANFILCRVENGWTAAELQSALMARGIMVRFYDKPELRGYIRISVGKPEHSDKLIAALSELGSGKPTGASLS